MPHGREIRISTHALREEGDVYPRSGRHAGRKISTHALREEGDDYIPDFAACALFLPTPSVRRATVLPGVVGHGGLEISTHALREEGDPRY